jgi:uncharacterized protein YlxW (UPF0749 family)
MPISITCNKCGKELEEPGALLFDTPLDNKCLKRHLCADCYHEVRRWIAGLESDLDGQNTYSIKDKEEEIEELKKQNEKANETILELHAENNNLRWKVDAVQEEEEHKRHGMKREIRDALDVLACVFDRDKS